MNKPQGSAAPPEQEAPLTAYKLQISGKFSPDGWDGAVQGFADGWRAALAAAPRPLTALVRRFLEWDQLRPPMSGDHAFWKREFEAALAASPRPLTEPDPTPAINRAWENGFAQGRLAQKIEHDIAHLGDPETAPLPLAESRAAESEPGVFPTAAAYHASPEYLRDREFLASQRGRAAESEPTEQQIIEAAEEAGLWPNTVRHWMPAFHRYHAALRAKLSQESRAGSAVSEPLPPLVKVLADWEDANGSLAGILQSEGDDLIADLARSAVEQSPRMLRATLEASKGSDEHPARSNP